jgi:hypothetical protein
MDERDEQAGGAQTRTAAEQEAPPAAGPDTPAPPPARPAALAEGWRTPVLWMACGALLAALAGGAAILAHRLSVESDMERVARLLPPAAGLTSTAPPESAPAPVPPPVPAVAPVAPPVSGDAGLSSTVPEQAPEAGAAVSGASEMDVEGNSRGEPRLPQTRGAAAHKTQTKAGKRPAKVTAIAAAKSAAGKESPRSPAARRRARELQNYYSVIFRRCPQPGEPGAIECRRHICNGAESEGPACKPYRNAAR